MSQSSKPMVEIKNRCTGAVMLSLESLTGADLRGADLRGADLRGANLTYANLRVANLTDADLTGADLTGADLRGADLTGADLRGADLRGAKNLDREILTIIGSCHVIVASARVVRIGCQCHTIDAWLDKFESIGKAAGYTAEQVEEYGGHLRKIKAVLALLGGAQ